MGIAKAIDHSWLRPELDGAFSPAALAGLAEVGRQLGIGIANMIAMTSLGRSVIGGEDAVRP